MVKQQHGQGASMAVETAPAPVAYDEWRDRRWRLTALAFALLWLVTVVAVGLVGEKRSDLGTLEAGIADGSVTSVELVGYDDARRGRTTVTLKWRGAVLSRFAEVMVDTRRTPGTSWEGDRIIGPPADYLRSGAPALAITRSDVSGFQEWRGWRASGWAVLLGLAAWLGTLLMAGSGPEPWRATKWGWTWLILFGGPLGSLGYLLLGGPMGRWRPRDLGRRLTGGWAFLVALVIFGGANAD